MKTLLFLADISGFTGFVQNAAPQVACTVTKALLEQLMEDENLGMSLHEVEGDALFFAKTEELPALKAVVEQAEEMYKKFNQKKTALAQHLKVDLSALSLKFVIHYGETTLLNINGQAKPFGREVVLAHQLLKNKIESNSYILFTSCCGELGALKGKKVITHTLQLEKLGEVTYCYIDMDALEYEVNNQQLTVKSEVLSKAGSLVAVFNTEGLSGMAVFRLSLIKNKLLELAGYLLQSNRTVHTSLSYFLF
jgi:hypothetical protein